MAFYIISLHWLIVNRGARECGDHCVLVSSTLVTFSPVVFDDPGDATAVRVVGVGFCGCCLASVAEEFYGGEEA